MKRWGLSETGADMKLFLLATAASIAIPAPASARNFRVLPFLYAEKYCMLRSLGAARAAAIETAIHESMIQGEVKEIQIDGGTYGMDVIESIEAVNAKCPEYLGQ